MPIRSRAFFTGQILAAHSTWTVVYTCPAGRTAIIKELALLNENAATLKVGTGLRRGSTWARTDWREATTTNTGLVWRGAFHVLQAGDALGILQVSPTSVSQTLCLTFSGALLLGDPS